MSTVIEGKNADPMITAKASNWCTRTELYPLSHSHHKKLTWSVYRFYGDERFPPARHWRPHSVPRALISEYADGLFDVRQVTVLQQKRRSVT